MFKKSTDSILTLCMVAIIILWGVESVACDILVRHMPPTFAAVTNGFLTSFLLSIIFLLARKTKSSNPPIWALWWTSISQAVFILTFYTAFSLTTAPRVVLCLAASPVWAVFWEALTGKSQNTKRSFTAAAIALLAIGILTGPALEGGEWKGDALAIVASICWVWVGNHFKSLGDHLKPMEIPARTWWRTACILTPLAIIEIQHNSISYTWETFGWQSYVIICSGIIALALQCHLLHHWPVSRVYTFENFITFASMAAAWLILGEKVTTTFLPAAALMTLAVTISQWQGHRKTTQNFG